MDNVQDQNVANGIRKMKRSLSRVFMAVAVLPALLGDSLPALSAEQTVTLSVNMWCPACPYIIKRTLAEVRLLYFASGPIQSRGNRSLAG